MATQESEIHDAIKQRICQASERDTTHIFRTLRNTARVFKNSVAMEVREKERHGAQFKDIQPLVSGTRGRQVYEVGDPEAGVWTAGLTVGLIQDIPTCKDLVARMEREAEEVITHTASLLTPRGAKL